MFLLLRLWVAETGNYYLDLLKGNQWTKSRFNPSETVRQTTRGCTRCLMHLTLPQQKRTWPTSRRAMGQAGLSNSTTAGQLQRIKQAWLPPYSRGSRAPRIGSAATSSPRTRQTACRTIKIRGQFGFRSTVLKCPFFTMEIDTRKEHLSSAIVGSLKVHKMFKSDEFYIVCVCMWMCHEIIDRQSNPSIGSW